MKRRQVVASAVPPFSRGLVSHQSRTKGYRTPGTEKVFTSMFLQLRHDHYGCLPLNGPRRGYNVILEHNIYVGMLNPMVSTFLAGDHP